MKPTGSIRESVAGRGILGSTYYDCLHSVLAVETWGDVGTLDEPIPPKAEYPSERKLIGRWAAECRPSNQPQRRSLADKELRVEGSLQ